MKKLLFPLIIVAVLLSSCGASTSDTTSNTKAITENTTMVESTDITQNTTNNVNDSSTITTIIETKKETEPVVADTSSSLTIGQKNALKSAKKYLEFSAFSHDGLVKQLKFEKYSDEDAIYAADNCGADWNEQAVKKAKSYLELTAFSRDKLISQLVFDGFTTEQATFGVEQNGY